MAGLDPELLQVFVAVAEHRSFTRAAGALNRTQSAVSMQIRRLEDALAVPLLHRTTTRVELSPAGEGFLPFARRILALGDEAMAQTRAHATEGHVRLGVMDDYGTALIPALLGQFALAYPHIRVEMETGLTGGMTGRLGQAFDLVIAMHAPGGGGGTLLRREPAIWVAGMDHAPETLDPLPLALYPAGCLFRQWATAALDGCGRSWRLGFVSHSLSAVAAVAAQGLAVTVVKSSLCPPGLRRLSPRDGLPTLPVAEIRLHRAPGLSHAGRLLAEQIEARFAE